MQLLYESRYQVLLHSEKDKMLVSEWKNTTSFFTDESYLVELHKLFSFFRRLKPLRYYCDVSNIRNNLSVEAQQFSANLFKDEKAKYCAIVTDKADVVPFVEGVVNELEILTDDFHNRYFQDRNLAMKWLLSCGNDPTILKSSPEAVNQH